MLAKAKNFLLDIVFPVRCVDCGKEGEWLCNECFKKIQLSENQVCPVCRCESEGGQVCEKCYEKTAIAGVRVAAKYSENPALAKAVKTLKYRFSRSLAGELGDLLVRSIENKSQKNLVVSFVPLHKNRQRWRGFNQAELLATAVAKKLDAPLEDLLVRVRDTQPQVKLSRNERLSNLKNAFEIRDKKYLSGQTIILVDDVATTGTSLEECAKAFCNSGAKEVWGLVVARG